MSGALAGLRVIDCSRLIAGGVLATVLADHGADVIKVENPRGGDPLRTWLRDRGELWWKVLGALLRDPRFATNDARLANNDLVDESPVYDIADVSKDPHVLARGILVDVPGSELGAVRMTAPTPRLGETL